jgi:hypothetical protein
MASLIARSLDLRGHAAPLARTAVTMLEVEPGALLEVLTDDPAAARDLVMWPGDRQPAAHPDPGGRNPPPRDPKAVTATRGRPHYRRPASAPLRRRAARC